MPWLGGLGVLSLLGNYEGLGVIPDWWDHATVAVFSVAVFYLGVRLALPTARVAAAARKEQEEAEAEESLLA